MVVIRGATTIAADEASEIQQAVKELLEEIEKRNGLDRAKIPCIVFSSTSDIHSYYPAKAAREAGFESPALFSAQEPEIRGALPLCIRVMILSDGDAEGKHVYLRGAKVLRRDLSQKLNIAIDGPAGSGKSTVAKLLAKDYKILYLDTGAMYRACALGVLGEGIDLNDEEGIGDYISRLDLTIEYQGGVQHTILDGKDVSEEIRLPHVSMAASTVSKYPAVRRKMVEKQREIAEKMSCVLDGRDICSYVLPNADFKFFLTASSEVRAKRRYDELVAKGNTVDFHALKAEIEARDLQDSTREFSPLKKADDATEIDSSDMTAEEVLAVMKKLIQEKI